MLDIREHPLKMPSLRGTASCTGCGRIIGRGEGQSFYLFESDQPKGPAMCWACAQRAEAEHQRDEARAETASLRIKASLWDKAVAEADKHSH